MRKTTYGKDTRIIVGLVRPPRWLAGIKVVGKNRFSRKDKSDSSQTREVEKYHAKLIHELDRRIDTVKHTLVAREEYKSDISALHIRINVISEKKADKILNIRTHAAKEKNGES